ncbi:exodeoxyribonuclease V subunit gamma [candidate division KSB1 bacterium]|nr:exodeoxyribonuclease V subunit gamma [candidate division KSB1 bacterium]
MPIHLFTSNRLEHLSEALAETLGTPLSSPLQPETIVVQSRGMQRWLSLELARKQGVCANVDFPFPNTFVHDIVRRILENVPNETGFEPPALTWRIMKVLPDLLKRDAFQQLQRYLQEPGRNLKRLQLAARLADLYDQYSLYRHEMIFRWGKGVTPGNPDERWQAELWRELVGGLEDRHRAALGKILLDTLQKTKSGNLDLPERVAVFGISALPPFHVDLLHALSGHTEVNVFFLNPCREFWTDILGKRQEQVAKRQDAQLTMNFSGGKNSLLASMGRLGGEFLNLLQDREPQEHGDLFAPPEESSLLGRIQADILFLQENRGHNQIEKKDRSIRIHACHSPRREVEVLQDHLLDLFENNHGLKPGDILIMAPDIEPYAPYIQTVFDLPADDPKRIPFSIADRSFRQENEIAETFFAILDLHGSRYGAAQVMSLLEVPAIRSKFGIKENDLDLIQYWVRETRIRWAKDAKQRGKLGLPEYPQNTWQAGLDRLLLGYALPGNDDQVYHDAIVPYDGVEGDRAEVLGDFLDFIQRLFERIAALGRKRSLQEWRAALEAILDAFFAVDDENAAQVQVVRRALADFDDFQQQSGFDQAIELRLVKYHLQTKLRSEGYGFGFLTGGVTFCSMLPMRSIPAKVVCLIGMNNGAYPRSSRALGFDLMAQKHQAGDRSRRHDDRYLFLESLISARETLYISYVGQSIKDNSVIPPSVVVSELLEYIETNYEMPDRKIAEHLTVKHKLQAFSPVYFGGGEKSEQYFSYSEENKVAAETLLSSTDGPPVFFANPLPEPDESLRQVTLNDLYRFFRNPVEHLFNKRLGVKLYDAVQNMTEKESFSLYGLDRYLIATGMLEKKRAGEDEAGYKSARLQSGELPHGRAGDSEYDALSQKVDYFVKKTEPYLQKKPLAPLNIDLALGAFHLTGTIEDIYADVHILYRYAKIKAKDLLRAWLHHLALSSQAAPGYPGTTILIGVNSAKEGVWLCRCLETVTNPGKILTNLLKIYWHGLRKPLRFFPDSALEYVQKLSNPKKDELDALKAAAQVWVGDQRAGGWPPGERDDPYFQRCFGYEENALNEEFKMLAQGIWEPLLKYQKDLS